MFESILTISITGLLAGFIFAMPIAGPISILITSNALKGRIRYSNLVSLGASFADFTYIFIAVYGLTKLYSLYRPAIPYMFAAGSLFFLFLGYKIIIKKFDIEHAEIKNPLAIKIRTKERGAFYTGLMINFLNPTLFIGGLTSSFFVISLVASLGLNTGGLELRIDQNFKEINNIEGSVIKKPAPISQEHINMLPKFKNHNHNGEQVVYPSYFHLVISICYAFFLAIGSVAWFHLLSYLIVKHRKRINVRFISILTNGLGVVLCLLGLYFGYLAIQQLF